MVYAYNPGIAMMGECPRGPGYRAEYPPYRFFGSNQAIAQAVLIQLPYKLRFMMPQPIYVLYYLGKRMVQIGPEKRNLQGPVGPIKY